MDADVHKLLSEAQIFESLENHPGWPIIVEKLNDMLEDATNTLNNVAPTKVEEVLAAHRDWRAVKQVKDTLLEYIKQTKEYAQSYTESQKENLQ
jgi:hypothetical protein